MNSTYLTIRPFSKRQKTTSPPTFQFPKPRQIQTINSSLAKIKPNERSPDRVDLENYTYDLKTVLLFILLTLAATAEPEIFMPKGAGVFLVRLNQETEKIEKAIVLKGHVSKKRVNQFRKQLFHLTSQDQHEDYRYALVSFKSDGLSSSSSITWVDPIRFTFRGPNGTVTLPRKLILRITSTEPND